jgi:hypothetical protein
VVQERLGHANIAITLDTYSHAVPVLEEQAAAPWPPWCSANEQVRRDQAVEARDPDQATVEARGPDKAVEARYPAAAEAHPDQAVEARGPDQALRRSLQSSGLHQGCSP